MESVMTADVADFVAQRAPETFYLQSAWLRLLERVYGYRVIPLVTHDAQGAVTGFLPLGVLRSRITGRRVVALPFSDWCPLLAADEAAANQLIDRARALADREHARYLELRTGANAVIAGRPDLVAGDMYVRFLVPLSPSSDEMHARLKKSVKGAIKKSRVLDVQVRTADSPADMAAYYQLHLRTRSRKHGMPTQPRRFFADMWETFGADGTVRLLLAEHEGKAIAGMVLFASGSTVRYAYGASHESYLHLLPNNLLMWEAMTWAGQAGYTCLDLGRTARDNEGLLRFKRGWGGVEEPLTYYYAPRSAGLAATSEHSWKYRLLTSAWRRLPLPVAEALGGRFYRHLG